MPNSVDRVVIPGALIAVMAAVTGFALPANAAPPAVAGKSAKKAAAPTVAPKKQCGASGKVSANKKTAPKTATPPGKRLTLTVLEGPDARGEISAITGDNEFSYLHLPPGAHIRQDGRSLTATDIHEGMKLVCWGSWDRYDTDVFDAVAVSVKGRLDDYALRNKISDACQKVSRRYVRTPVASAASANAHATVTEAAPALAKPTAAAPPAGSSAPTAPATPAPTTGTAPGATPAAPPADAPTSAIAPSTG